MITSHPVNKQESNKTVMETYPSFYYIRWKAILKGLTMREGDCYVKHHGENPGDTESNVNNAGKFKH